MENILPPDLFEKTKKHYLALVKSNEMEHDTREFKRLYKHRDYFFDYLHKGVILDHAHKMFGINIKPSYSFLSYYNSPDSICPIHTDRPQCRYSIDMAIIQDFDWPIYVKFKPYLMRENQALCYSGTNDIHYRNKIPQHKPVGLAFFHFVDSDFKGSLN